MLYLFTERSMIVVERVVDSFSELRYILCNKTIISENEHHGLNIVNLIR